MTQQPQDQPRPTQSSVRCAHCGYSMDALSASAACPECGGGGRITWLNGVPVADGRDDDIGVLYRPVIRTMVSAALLCVATSAIAARTPRGSVVGEVAIVVLLLAWVVLVLVGPIWASVVAARRSHQLWGSHSGGDVVRHLAVAIGTAVIVGTLGFVVGFAATLPGMALSGARF